MSRFLTRDRVFILALLIRILIVVALLIYYPALDTLQTSFTNENLRIRRPAEFIGLENYAEGRRATRSSGRSPAAASCSSSSCCRWSCCSHSRRHYCSTSGSPVVAIACAPWGASPGWCRPWSTASCGAGSSTASSAPSTASLQFGPSTRSVLGCASPHEPATLWVAVVQTWTRFAFPTIILLAGLQGIPDELSRRCGQGRWRQRAPSAAPHHAPELAAPSFTAIVPEPFKFIAAFQIFDVIWTLTSGGSAGGSMNPFTKTLINYNYESVLHGPAHRPGLGPRPTSSS